MLYFCQIFLKNWCICKAFVLVFEGNSFPQQIILNWKSSDGFEKELKILDIERECLILIVAKHDDHFFFNKGSNFILI